MMKATLFFFFLFLLAACAPAIALPNTPVESSALIASDLVTKLALDGQTPFFPLALTQQNVDGNRYVPGQMDLAHAQMLDIALEGRPAWVLGIGLAEGRSLWLAVLEDGRVQAFHVEGEQVAKISGFPTMIPAGAPPVLAMVDGEIELLNALAPESSAINHPILLGDAIWALDDSGALSQLGQSPRASGFLPDGRILSDGSGRLLLLSAPSDVYAHGVLGDAFEAQALTLLDVANGESIEIGRLRAGQTYEALMPIWADLDGDDQREILVTSSNAQNGAQLLLYSEAGELLASSEAIGLGFRWRNQMAIAPLGLKGEWEIVDVRIPHIGGIVEFFAWQGQKLTIIAQIEGYTSHVNGSRNLDMALAADVNADGRVEVLLPNQNLNMLAAIQRTPDGAEVVWEIPLGAGLTTNLATARFADGSLALGLGLDSQILRLWLP